MKTRIFYTLTVVLLVQFHAIAQTDFDQQLKILSNNIYEKINAPGKKIMVGNFKYLQKDTELGQYLADALSVELTNTKLKVIDRSGKDIDAEERKMQAEKSIASNKKDRGTTQKETYDYFITGTINLFDSYIVVTVKILNTNQGLLVGGTRGQLPRTNAINSLLNTTNQNAGNNSVNPIRGQKINTDNKSSIDDLFGAQISELRKGECQVKYKSDIVYYGQVCFENQTGEDIMFYCTSANPEGWLTDYKVIIPNGGRNCSRLIAVNWDQNGLAENTSRQASFEFYSIDERRRAKQSFIIDKCTVKSFVLTKNNLVLMKN